MDEKLHQWIRLTRRETCPARVRESVRKRLAERAESAHAGRTAWALTAAAGVALALILALWGPAFHPAPGGIGARAGRIALDPGERAQVAEAARHSLAYIGRVLIDTGVETRTALLTRATPPLFPWDANTKKPHQRKNPIQ